MIGSSLSSALNTVSVPAPVSRFFSFILTTAALRPDLLNSAFWITQGWPLMLATWPARNSCAVFITDVRWRVTKRVAYDSQFVTARNLLTRDRRLQVRLATNPHSWLARSSWAASWAHQRAACSRNAGRCPSRRVQACPGASPRHQARHTLRSRSEEHTSELQSREN